MLYLLSEEKSRILDETFWKSLEYRRDFYFRENVIPYLQGPIQHGTKTHLTEVFMLRTTLLLMQNNIKGLEKQQLGGSKEGEKE